MDVVNNVADRNWSTPEANYSNISENSNPNAVNYVPTASTNRNNGIRSDSYFNFLKFYT